MDWNTILLINSLLLTGAFLVRLALHPARSVALLAECLGLLALIGVVWWRAPEVAGYVGAAVCGLLLVAPGLVRRRINVLCEAEAYRAAARWSQVARVLHPIGFQRHEPALLRAHALATEGRREEAVALFTRFAHLPASAGVSSRIQIHRLRRAWGSLVELVAPLVDVPRPGVSIVFLPALLRGLGETGERARLVATFQRLQPLLDDRGLEAVRTQSRLMLFTFAGERAGTDVLLENGAGGPRHESQAFLRATAAIFAGARAEAAALLEPLTRSGNALVGDAARDRLAQTLADGGTGPAPLAAAERAFVETVAAEAAHEARLSTGIPADAPASLTTWTLLAANVVLFGATLALGGPDDGRTLHRLGAVFTGGVPPAEAWRVLAANFLHGGTAHIALNMFGLVALGRYVELRLGRGRFLAVYLAAGVIAMGGVLAATRLGWQPPTLIVGASGCVMGLVGAQAAIFLDDRVRTGARVAGRHLRQVGALIALQFGFDQLFPNVSSTAHLCGLIGGFAATWLVTRRRQMNREQRCARPHGR